MDCIESIFVEIYRRAFLLFHNVDHADLFCENLSNAEPEVILALRSILHQHIDNLIKKNDRAAIMSLALIEAELRRRHVNLLFDRHMVN